MENLIIDFIENLSEMKKIELYNNYCLVYDNLYEDSIIIGFDELKKFCDYDEEVLQNYIDKNEYFNKNDKYFYYIAGIIESTNNYTDVFSDSDIKAWLQVTIQEKSKTDLFYVSQPLFDKIVKYFDL